MSAFPRPLTEREKYLLTEALRKRKRLQKYLSQVDDLQVAGECGCGDPSCESVYFQYYERGKSEAVAHEWTEDGKIAVVFVNREINRLSELEII